MSTAPAPEGIRSSAARPRFLPDGVAQTASSDLRGWGMPDIRTNTSIHDISDGTDPGCAANPRLQYPTPGASCDGDTRLVLRLSPHSAHAGRDISCTLHPQTAAAFPPTPSLRW